MRSPRWAGSRKALEDDDQVRDELGVHNVLEAVRRLAQDLHQPEHPRAGALRSLRRPAPTAGRHDPWPPTLAELHDQGSVVGERLAVGPRVPGAARSSDLAAVPPYWVGIRGVLSTGRGGGVPAQRAPDPSRRRLRSGRASSSKHQPERSTAADEAAHGVHATAGTYSPSARTGRRDGGSGQVTGHARRHAATPRSDAPRRGTSIQPIRAGRAPRGEAARSVAGGATRSTPAGRGRADLARPWVDFG